MKNTKTKIICFSIVIIFGIISFTLLRLSKETYTIRIEATEEVKGIVDTLAQKEVSMYQIKNNCTKYIQAKEKQAKLMELIYACKQGCEKSFDELNKDFPNAVCVAGFCRYSCFDVCVNTMKGD